MNKVRGKNSTKEKVMINASKVKILLWIGVTAIGLGLVSYLLMQHLNYQSQLRHTYSLAYALGLSDQDLLKSDRYCLNLWSNCGPGLIFETDLSLSEFEARMEQLGAGRSRVASSFGFLNYFGYQGVTFDGQDYLLVSRNSQLENLQAEDWSFTYDGWSYIVCFTEIAEQPDRLAYEGKPFNRNVVYILFWSTR